MCTKITYTKQGDYNLPNLTLPEQDERNIGVWGARRRRYLREHHRILYYNLLTSCKLHNHLADVNEEATAMYERLVKQFAEADSPFLVIRCGVQSTKNPLMVVYLALL